jgi:hypothetical protein
MSLDVKQVYGVAKLETLATSTETLEVSGGLFKERKAAPPMPPQQPQKITVSASVQCAFQIQ